MVYLRCILWIQRNCPVPSEQGNPRQAVPLPCLEIVKVVCRGDLHGAGTELPIHKNRVGHHRDGTFGEWKLYPTTNKPIVPGISRVNSNGSISQHRLRPCGGND